MLKKQIKNGSKSNYFIDEKENLHPDGRTEKFNNPRSNLVSTNEIHNEDPREIFRIINPNANQVPCSLPGSIIPEVENIKQTTGAVKENVYNIAKDELDDFDSSQISVIDISSPMSLDISVESLQLTGDSIAADELYQNLDTEHSTPSRNECQRCFEVIDYQKDILERFHESELKHMPNARYMHFQNDINHNMRSIAIDWLVDVAEEYSMDTETIYLTVCYMDRFLSRMAVVRSKLQLVAVASLFIAAKYEETYPPGVSDLLSDTDYSYTKEQLLHMEQAVLKVLSFNLCTPTAHVFINAYSVLFNMTEKLKYLTLFLCELSLVEGVTYLKYFPSLISSASLALARHILGMDIWNSQLEEITTYMLDDLKIVILQLCQTHNASKKLKTQAILDKYNKKKYQKVASIEPIELTKNQLDKLCLTILCERQTLKKGVIQI